MMAPLADITIYALTDPLSEQIRYVGQTTGNVWQRYAQHIALLQGQSAKTAWIRRLIQQGQVPGLKILEEHVSLEDAYSRERHWLTSYLEAGYGILNAVLKPSGTGTPDSPLRRWRRQHRFTQGQLGRACGVTGNTVARWEKAEQEGGRKPAGEALVRLIDQTHLAVEALVYPERYLREHPHFFIAWASEAQGRGRPRQPPASEEG
jgi:transcriptional regulator with XRE-family HTH domain